MNPFLEVSKKELNAGLWGSTADQKLILAFARAPELESGQVSPVSTKMLGPEFSGEIGATISSGKACLGILITEPKLVISQGEITLYETIHGATYPTAFRIAAAVTYGELAGTIIESLFLNCKNIDPSLRMTFKDAVDGNGKTVTSVESVEVIMSGVPTRHPFWGLG